ncbi:MAG: aldehyde dehydrogenase family protein [Gammaproteobacteria bacterium]|nr:aldehyde dehydrogenase family protein [Gammaproteobacteria bacterium]
MTKSSSASGSDTLLSVSSPYSGELLAQLDTASMAEVQAALTRAAELHRDRRQRLSLQRRIEILHNTARIMTEQAEELARLAASEGGKPLLDSRIEVTRAIDGVQLCIEALRHDGGRLVPMNLDAASSGRVAFTQKEPIGVVVAVSAFNHPLNLIVHQVAPAIAAGCPVLVKPAEDTPLSCQRFVEILYQAGLPEPWCRMLVTRDLAVAEALVTDPRVGLFSFIGSARVGWMLRSKVAPGTRCLLEHGGAAPVVVFNDADIPQAVKALTRGAFYHAGQVCVSVQRIFAHADIAALLAQQLARAANNLVLGDPLDSSTEVGPLIRAAEVERVDNWVREAIDLGAHSLSGAAREGSNLYRPTVLSEVPADCTLSRNEVFGPVAAVYSFDDADSAFRVANDLPFAFQAAVFTRDIQNMMRAFHALDGSAVMVNDHSAFRTDWMPFAGLKQSGLGVGGIAHTLHEMQIEKMLVLHCTDSLH